MIQCSSLTKLLIPVAVLVLLPLTAVNCQSSSSSSSPISLITTTTTTTKKPATISDSNQSPAPDIITTTISPTKAPQVTPELSPATQITTTPAPTTTTTGEVLLSGNEFVDYTETPTLLFDGISNSTNVTATTTTATPESQNATSSSTNGADSLNTTTAAPEAETSPSDSVDDGDSESSGEEDSKDAPNGQQAYEPPKNVSQYMDYIERLFHDLRHQITDLFEPHIPQLIRTSQMVQLSGSCSYDMLRMAFALRQFEPWALRMIDSSGKVPEGIFEGSFTALGSYDECISTIFASKADHQQLQDEKQQHQHQQQQQPATQGKYCLVNVSPFLPPKPPADKVELMFQEEANRRNYTKDDQFSRLSPMFYYMKFRIGVCVPSTCVDSDLDSISNALSSSLRLNITIPHCRMKQSQPITSHQLAGGLIFALVLVLVCSATLMDYWRRKLDRLKRHERLLLLGVGTHQHQIAAPSAVDGAVIWCQKNDDGEREVPKLNQRLEKHWSWMSFSLLTNFKLYFNNKSPTITTSTSPTNQHRLNTEPSAMVIRCLNGIRVISLCWVIVANSYITLDPRATKRLTKTREAPKDFLFQLVAQASLAIETFFFLSGILMSLSFARQLHPDKEPGEKQDNRRASYLAQWVRFYVHRYVRMTPATMLVIAFTMFAFRYGDGPLWFEATHKAHLSCSENWWRHLLHVANFIDTRSMCFIHYWYIAADMQLFLFAPLLMLLLHRRRRVGYVLAALVGSISIGSVFYTTYSRNLPPTLLFYNSDPESRREFGNSIMTKPLTHALPYMVGMLVGKWLTADASQPSWLTRDRPGQGSLRTLIGLLATLVALAEVFLPYKWNNSHLPTRLMASLYASLFRLCWSLVLAYLVISCAHQRGRRCASARTQQQKRHSSCSNCHGKDQIVSTSELGASGETDAKNESFSLCFCGRGGNLVNRLLSLNVFAHLSRLSFVAYLIHLPLMSVFIAQTRGLFAFSHTLVIHLALSYLVITFILSFVLVHIIEFPFVTFERYLFEKLFNTSSKREQSAKATKEREDKPPPLVMMMDNKWPTGERFRMDDGHYRSEQRQQQHSYIGGEDYKISERL